MNIDVEQDATAPAAIISGPRAAGLNTSRHMWLRKIASSELVIWAALVLLFSTLPIMHIDAAMIADADIWWHMRAGEWIMQHHQVPHVDPFSASTMGQPWVDYTWLFDLVTNGIISHFDLAFILWYQIAMRLAITAALFALLRSLTPRFWYSVALTGLGMVAMIPMFGPRPALFSVLFLILELHLLLLAQRTGNLRALWAIPFLFAIWANIHIELVHGLFLLGVFCAEPLLERILRKPASERTPTAIPNRTLWLVLGASLLATIATPYGVRLHSTAIHLARDVKLYDAIQELRAMQFRSPADWAVLLIVMLACFALGKSPRARIVWMVLLAWSTWMAFRSLREVWLVTIIGVVIIASKDVLDAAVRTRIGLLMRFAVGTTVTVLLLGSAAYCRMTSQNLFRQVSQSFPVGAVSFIHRNHVQGPLLNEFSWGGFLIYSLPEIPVAIDGRTNVHSQDDVLHSISLYNGQPGWRKRPELLKANLVICDHKWPLTGLLRSDPQFRVVYEDLVAVVFQPVSQPASSEVKSAP